MKIAVASPGPEREHIDGFGALEMRFLVNYAHFLRTEGNDVHFFNTDVGCDSSFDLALGCLIERCDNVKAKKHVHHSFNPKCLKDPVVQNTECYQSGKYIYSNPYREEYIKGLGMMSRGFKHQHVFLPIPYPDDLKPKNLINGFCREEIMWGNKGNFDPVIDVNHPNYHYVTNGIATLKALIRLNKKVDFKITFLLDSVISRAKPEWEVEELIAQLKHVERLDKITWTELVARMGKCKLNTHVGGLTSSVNEAIFTGCLPVTPENSVHLPIVNLMRPADEVTSDEIYDTFERLWFDWRFYGQVHEEFQEVFKDHRTPGLRKHWQNFFKTIA